MEAPRGVGNVNVVAARTGVISAFLFFAPLGLFPYLSNERTGMPSFVHSFIRTKHLLCIYSSVDTVIADLLGK